MNDEEIQRLLGGYATDQLSEQERSALFEAALEDQALFNALEDEESLRDLLSDAESRREIERALRAPAVVTRPPWYRSVWAWGLAGSLAGACVLVVVMVRPQNSPQVAAVMPASKSMAESVPAASVAEPKPQSPTPRRRAAAPVVAADKAAPVSAPAPAREEARTGRVMNSVGGAPRAAAPVVDSDKPVPVPVPAPAPEEERKEKVSESAAAAPPAPPPQQSPAQNQSVAIIAAPGGSPAVMGAALRDQVQPSRMAKKAAPPILVAVVPSENGAIRLRVRPAVEGVLSVVQLDARGVREPLGQTVTVQPGRDYLLPDSAIPAGTRANLLVLLTPADGRVQTTEVILVPGQAPLIR
jgi:hypothetical protein